jgi:molybdopterin adenylyltransferase
MSHVEHQQRAASIVARCGVLTLSDTRTPETDVSGQHIQKLLAESKHAGSVHVGSGHVVQSYQVIPDDPHVLETTLKAWLGDSHIDCILTNGGTGVSKRDQTIPVIERIIDQPLPGFGELFRMLSYQQVGSSAMLSRAIAGIANGKPIFAMPGSTKAVDLAMTQLVLPQLKHILSELRK